MHQAGSTIDQITKVVARHRATVYRWLKKIKQVGIREFMRRKLACKHRRQKSRTPETTVQKIVDIRNEFGWCGQKIRKELEEIGLFDEDFFAYFEDVDISFRAQLAGWKVRYEPKAVAYHHIGSTSSKLGNFSLYHSSKNFMLLYAKNMPAKLYWKYLPLFSLQLSRWFITSLLRGHLWTFLKGMFAAIHQHPKTAKKRKIIQASRKVSVGYIDSMLYHHRPPRPPKL